MRILILTALLGTAGCGGSSNNQKDAGDASASMEDAGHDDMTGMPVDLSNPVRAPIGGVCTNSSDCEIGKICAIKYSGLSFPQGYCTKLCSPANDTCGANSFCLDPRVDGLSPICVASCNSESVCRGSDGYSCLVFGSQGACFPRLPDNYPDLCDPMIGDGTCATAGHPGGCFRYRYGSGNAGLCHASCVLGTGTCPSPAAPDGGSTTPQHCVASNEQMNGFNDKFVGAVCVSISDEVAPNFECLSSDGNHYPEGCVDGYECDVRTNGDKKCHPFCYPDGAPDGGVPDGGTEAGGCSDVGSTCTRIWGDNVNLGLCIPVTI